MHIHLAFPRGFCAGVNRAISTLAQVVQKYGAPVWVFHEIVHNTWVVRDFQQQGVYFVDSLDKIPDGSCVMYSAHGVAPEIREQAKQKSLRVIDATCPLVARIHVQARKLADAGYQIVLIGHAGHDEVVGIQQEAPHAIRILRTPDEAETLMLEDDSQPLAYLTQTTLSVAETAAVVAILKRRFPQIHEPQADGICFATQNRQRAVRELACTADIVLVIGSSSSSNSRRLQELAAKQGVTAYLVDGVEDLQADWFTPTQNVLITAGASAPEQIVQSVVAYLQENYQADVEECRVCDEFLQFQLPIL